MWLPSAPHGANLTWTSPEISRNITKGWRMDRLRKMQCCKSWLVPLDLCLRRWLLLDKPLGLENGAWLAFVGVSKRKKTQNRGEEPICSHCFDKSQGPNPFWLWFNMLRWMLSSCLAANSIHVFSQIACKATRLTHWYSLGTLGWSHFFWHCCSTCETHFYQFCRLHLLLLRLKEVTMLKSV